MKLVLLAAVCSFSVAAVQAGQTARPRQAPPSVTAGAEQAAEAYNQYLLGRHLAAEDKTDGAIAAFKKAIEHDPLAAEVVSELAALYLRLERVEDAIATAEQALKIAPGNREAHRVLGIVYAALADSGRGPRSRTDKADDYVARAIQHLEAAIDRPVGEPDGSVRAMLARQYVRSGAHDKAIALLTTLIGQEPGWSDGPALLAEAYAGAGRTADAIQWFEAAVSSDPALYPTLADFYERGGRWTDAVKAYASALLVAPRNVDLKKRYAAALLNVPGRVDAGKARDVLTDVLAARPSDARALYLLSQAERRLGDLKGAEATARRVMAQNARSPWGYYALAQALEERRQYRGVIEALAPAVADFRSRGTAEHFELGLLLPHLGFAHQALREHDKAVEIFGEAHRLSPEDAAITGYLIEANLAAKKYAAAIELARQARVGKPTDLGLARLEAEALRQSGMAERGIAVLEQVAKARPDDPLAYVALAQLYADASRGAEGVKLLRDAGAKFPGNTAIAFELGAVLEKQKRFNDAEAAFRQVIAVEPDHAAALNYLGYMLAERGERLDESVAYLKKATALEPENGSYLDSLGWAYFKADKLDLAERNLKIAADQLQANSVVQSHYAELLFKRGRYGEAIAAWTRALAGDGDTINRAEIDKKIRAARRKLGRK